MKKLKRLSIVVGIFIILGISTGLVIMHQKTYYATDQAVLVSKEAEDRGNYLLFGDPNSYKGNLIIFYPGALVESISYSIWAEQLAQEGFPVAIAKFPLSLAVFAPNRAEDILADFPDKTFVIGGHSLGGVMASRFAAAQIAQENEQLQGVYFLASYPDEKGELSQSKLSVLSITASQDGVLNTKAFKHAKEYLPETTIFAEIEGGNHAGFGDYGPQSGDQKATISPEEQQDEMVDQMISWLYKINQ